MSLKERFILNFVSDDRWKYLVNGLKVTMIVAFFAALLGIAIGFLLAIIRATHDKEGKLKVLNFIAHIKRTHV